MVDAGREVAACGEVAKKGAASLAAADDTAIDGALREMARLLASSAPAVLAANRADLEAGQSAGLGRGVLDRLRLDTERIGQMARQIELLAGVEFPAAAVRLNDLPGGLRLEERRRPIGVVGANYEARPNVTVDVASQLLKSRNAGVLRTGAAALRSAVALFDTVIVPALTGAGLDAAALQLVRSAARHGVRTLAHADGGGVLYLDRAADPALAAELITGSLDRLGVCNRLNLLLVHAAAWDRLVAVAEQALRARGVAASMPPH